MLSQDQKNAIFTNIGDLDFNVHDTNMYFVTMECRYRSGMKITSVTLDTIHNYAKRAVTDLRLPSNCINKSGPDAIMIKALISSYITDTICAALDSIDVSGEIIVNIKNVTGQFRGEFSV